MRHSVKSFADVKIDLSAEENYVMIQSKRISICCNIEQFLAKPSCCGLKAYIIWVIILLQINYSRTFDVLDSNEMRQQFLTGCGLPALATGTILWTFQLVSRVAQRNERENRWRSGSVRDSAQFCNTLEEIFSMPGDFSTSSKTRA